MRTLFALALVGLAFAPLALAGLNHSIGVDENGVILSGYDAVAYFTQDKAVKGSPDITASYKGAIYRFSTKGNRDMFVKDPAKYAPQFGGWCAYGVALGKKFNVDGKAFAVLDGKLFMNLDKSIQKKWDKDRAKFIKDANETWPGIVDKSAAELN